MRWIIVVAVTIAALPALGQQDADPFAILDPLDQQMSTGLDSDDLATRPEAAPPALPAPVPAPGQVEQWRRQLLGVPVVGAQAGKVGRVDGLIVGMDGRVASVVVDFGDARVPVPWAWVERQIGRPVIALPWRRQDLDWLTGAD